MLFRFATLFVTLASCSAHDGLRGGARDLQVKQTRLYSVQKGKSARFSCTDGPPHGSGNKCTFTNDQWRKVDSIVPRSGSLEECLVPTCPVECDLSCMLNFNTNDQAVGGSSTGQKDDQAVGGSSVGEPSGGPVTVGATITVQPSRAVEFRCMQGGSYGVGNACVYTESDWEQVIIGSAGDSTVLDKCINPAGCPIACSASCMKKYVKPGTSSSGAVSGASTTTGTGPSGTPVKITVTRGSGGGGQTIRGSSTGNTGNVPVFPRGEQRPSWAKVKGSSITGGGTSKKSGKGGMR